MPRDPLIQFSEQRSKQIGTICLRYSGRPLPTGMKKEEMSRHLERMWNEGYLTGMSEIHDKSKVNVNKERKNQVGEAVLRLGLETEADIEVFIHVWTAGLLTARDMMGINTPTDPGQRGLTRVKVDDG